MHGEFPEIFEGIDALIHVASPLAGREDPDSTIKTAVEGTLNMLRQAEKAGISRIVVTSSIATAMNKVADTSDATIKDSGKPINSYNGIDISTLRETRLELSSHGGCNQNRKPTPHILLRKDSCRKGSLGIRRCSSSC